jgi:signal transduction histidine kinase
LGLFADLASIAIKNAELHTQIKQFNQELEQMVAARTHELSNAKDQIAIKADQLRSLWAETIRVQENERARIARDMHDDVVQLITATRLELDAAEIIARPELKPDARDKLVAARERLDEMEKQIRRAIYNLHPPSLDAVGLVPAMQNYVRRFRQISGIDCRMEIIGNPLRLFGQSENSIYHMIEAALSNVAAHAEATATTVIFDFQPSLLCISVSDNGHGFDYSRWMRETRWSGQHLGLLGMQERVEGLGGQMDVESTPGQGTRLRFKIPI